MPTSKYQSNIERFSSIATDPLRTFRFRADFSAPSNDQFDSRITSFSGGFQSISGLSINVAATPYREGGYNTTAHMVPGQTTFDPITMSRGVLYGNDQAITWMRGLFAVTAGEGLDLGALGGANTKNFRCNIKIYAMEHPNADADSNVPRIGFIVRNAWPSMIRFSDLNAMGNDLMMETVTFVHEGLSVFYTKPDGTPADSTYKLSGV